MFFSIISQYPEISLAPQKWCRKALSFFILLFCLQMLTCVFTIAYATQDGDILTNAVRNTMTAYFNKSLKSPNAIENLLNQQTSPPPSFRKPAGVFVTLSKNGKPRACWGSLFPEQRDVVQSTIITTIGALTKEYRYAPIKQSELKDLKPQVTLIRGIEPIQTISSINPLRDGLMVRSGAKSGIILPGEVKDAFYQMVQCKLKAGISPGEPFQMYRIKADVFH